MVKNENWTIIFKFKTKKTYYYLELIPLKTDSKQNLENLNFFLLKLITKHERLNLPPEVYFRDYAGGCSVHAVGGVAALIGCIFIGPRLVKG